MTHALSLPRTSFAIQAPCSVQWVHYCSHIIYIPATALLDPGDGSEEGSEASDDADEDQPFESGTALENDSGKCPLHLLNKGRAPVP